MRNTDTTREYIKSLKTECSRCKYDDPDVLVFHHTNPQSKSCDIGPHLTIETINEEVKKCEILCHNCHWKAHRTIRATKKRPRSEKATKARELSKIGANIARGIKLEENLSALPTELLGEINSVIKKIMHPPTQSAPLAYQYMTKKYYNL